MRSGFQGDVNHCPEKPALRIEVRNVPIYEYRCEKCKHVMEFLESYGDDTKEHRCQKCGSRDVRKILSVPTIRTADGSKPTGGSCPTGTCPLT